MSEGDRYIEAVQKITEDLFTQVVQTLLMKEVVESWSYALRNPPKVEYLLPRGIAEILVDARHFAATNWALLTNPQFAERVVDWYTWRRGKITLPAWMKRIGLESESSSRWMTWGDGSSAADMRREDGVRIGESDGGAERSDMKLFVGYIQAARVGVKDDGKQETEIGTRPYFCVGEGQQNQDLATAQGTALHCAFQKFPREDGWYGHYARVIEAPFGWSTKPIDGGMILLGEVGDLVLRDGEGYLHTESGS